MICCKLSQFSCEASLNQLLIWYDFVVEMKPLTQTAETSVRYFLCICQYIVLKYKYICLIWVPSNIFIAQCVSNAYA